MVSPPYSAFHSRRWNLLHSRGGVVIELEMQCAKHHAVHPVGRDHVEQLDDLLVAQVALQFRESRVLDKVASDELVGGRHDGAFHWRKPVETVQLLTALSFSSGIPIIRETL